RHGPGLRPASRLRLGGPRARPRAARRSPRGRRAGGGAGRAGRPVGQSHPDRGRRPRHPRARPSRPEPGWPHRRPGVGRPGSPRDDRGAPARSARAGSADAGSRRARGAEDRALPAGDGHAARRGPDRPGRRGHDTRRVRARRHRLPDQALLDPPAGGSRAGLSRAGGGMSRLFLDARTARVTCTILVILSTLAIAYAVRSVLLLVALSLFFAYLLFPFVRLAERWVTRRRALAIALVYLVVLASLGGAGAAFGPRLTIE